MPNTFLYEVLPLERFFLSLLIERFFVTLVLVFLYLVERFFVSLLERFFLRGCLVLYPDGVSILQTYVKHTCECSSVNEEISFFYLSAWD
jgi:hypothetical protein